MSSPASARLPPNAAWRHVAVAGAGAVGSFYGAMLARAGHRVTLIGRAAHVEAIDRHGLQLEMHGRAESIRIAASTELVAARGADLVLICVKSDDTEAMAQRLASVIDADTVVVSLQNGVENVPAIARQLPRHVIVPAVVYVATAMPAPGCVRHHGRGDLVIGARDAAALAGSDVARMLGRLVGLFASAEVAVTISGDVIAELWGKLMVNCAYNAISALAQAPYRQLAALGPVRELQRELVREVVALAAAEGVNLALEPSLKAMEAIASAMPAQRSSTAQDLARRKRSEIDHLNGFVARRGRELGVPTPANQALHALVKLVESQFGEPAR